jgi:hypothetical protein
MRIRIKSIHGKSTNGAKGFTDTDPPFPATSSIHKWDGESVISKIIILLTGKLLALIGFGSAIDLVFVKQ